jgi:phosphoenolpyruvate carboxykinase (ATP)
MISAALEGKLDEVEFKQHPVFGFQVPQSCPTIPSEILNPRATWPNPEDYDKQAKALANSFVTNFDQFKDFASVEILSGAPKV